MSVDRQFTFDDLKRILVERVGLPEDVLHSRVADLAPGQKQLVEIARALGTAVRVLIMDEPTSSLTQAETERLYGVIAGLKAAGVSVLYISHRLAEVKRCADRVAVLRDGRNAGELAGYLDWLSAGAGVKSPTKSTRSELFTSGPQVCRNGAPKGSRSPCLAIKITGPWPLFLR